MSNLAKEIAAYIRSNPEKCRIDGYRFYVSKGVALWVESGYLFLEPYNCNLPSDSFGFFDKFTIWRAYKWWLNNCPIEHLNKNQCDFGDEN